MSEEILLALCPLGIEAGLSVIDRHHDNSNDRRDALRRQLQQLRYEAQRAFDQYDQVDSQNR